MQLSEPNSFSVTAASAPPLSGEKENASQKTSRSSHATLGGRAVEVASSLPPVPQHSVTLPSSQQMPHESVSMTVIPQKSSESSTPAFPDQAGGLTDEPTTKRGSLDILKIPASDFCDSKQVTMAIAQAVPMMPVEAIVVDEEEERGWAPLKRGNTIFGTAQGDVELSNTKAIASAPEWQEEMAAEASAQSRERTVSEEFHEAQQAAQTRAADRKEKARLDALNQKIQEWTDQSVEAYQKGKALCDKDDFENRAVPCYQEAGKLFKEAAALVKKEAAVPVKQKERDCHADLLALRASFLLEEGKHIEKPLSADLCFQNQQKCVLSAIYKQGEVWCQFFIAPPNPMSPESKEVAKDALGKYAAVLKEISLSAPSTVRMGSVIGRDIANKYGRSYWEVDSLVKQHANPPAATNAGKGDCVIS